MYLPHKIYFLILGLLFLTGVLRWRKFSLADRSLSILISITTLVELLAFYFDLTHHNNLFLFHFFGPIQLSLFGLYFFRTLAHKFSKSAIVVVSALGTFFSIYNSLLLQDINSLNSNFLLFQAVAIILFCLMSFHELLLKEDLNPYQYTQFWVSAALLIFWSSTFTTWGLYNFIPNNQPKLISVVSIALITINYVYYSAIAVVFIFYARLIPSGERT